MDKIKSKTINIIDLYDWDELVRKVYNRTYSLQQQNGCMERQLLKFTVPSTDDCDEEMNDDVPEIINGEEMGVKFATWLARDPNTPLKNQEYSWQLDLFWERNFYPDFDTIVNDLYKKGLIDEGNYGINID